MVRPMVHSTKHYPQHSLETVTAGTVDNNVIVDAVAVGNKDDPKEVEEGNSVKAVYVEHWVRSGETSPGSYAYAIYKVPGGGAAFTAAQMAAIHDADNKKNILFFSQALTNNNTSNAIPVIREWVKIPKSKQRFGLGDRLIATHFAQALDSITCGFNTYKEYS